MAKLLAAAACTLACVDWGLAIAGPSASATGTTLDQVFTVPAAYKADLTFHMVTKPLATPASESFPWLQLSPSMPRWFGALKTHQRFSTNASL